MVRKAKAGHVTGGKVFGYDHVKVDGHTERRVNEAHAEVIRRIFALCASGTGYTRIAKLLNAERVPAPRPQQARPAGWSPSTINEVLHRSLYRGEVVWNKTKKRDAAGRTAPTARPEAEWMRFDRPDLRIVSDEVWHTAHARLGGIRSQLATARGGQPAGRRRDIDSKYLLSGFARCARCGGTLSVVSQERGKRGRVFFYGCLAHYKRGATVCDNALVLPIDRVDNAVVSRLSRDVLHPAVVKGILDGVFEALQPATATKNVGALQKELRALDTKIANLTTAIEDGAAVAPLVAKLQARQQEREALLTEIGAAEAIGQLTIDRQTVERKVMERIAGWRTRLATDGRQVLREVLRGPLRFDPSGTQYQFEGGTRTGELITGLIGDSTLCGVPSGYRALFSTGNPALAAAGGVGYDGVYLLSATFLRS